MRSVILAGAAIMLLFALGMISSAMAYQAAPRSPAAGKIDSIKNAIASRAGNLTNEEVGKLGIIGRVLAGKMANADASQIKSALHSMKTMVVQKGQLLRNRVIAEAQLKASAERLGSAKLGYDVARLNAIDAKAKLIALKGSYAQCRNSSTEQCIGVKARALESARNLATNSYDRLISYLDKLKERIESSQFINSTNAQDAVDEIGSALSLLEAGKQKAKNASAAAEIRNASLELSRVIRGIKTAIKLHEVRVVRAYVSEVFERARHLERRMELVLAKLNSSGIDTGEMEQKLDEFSAKVDDAKEKMNNSLALFRDAAALRKQALNCSSMNAGVACDGNVSEAEHVMIAEKLDASRSFAKEAQALLKEAHVILVDIAKQVKTAIRGMGQQVSDAELLDANTATAIVQEPAQIEVVEVDSGE